MAELRKISRWKRFRSWFSWDLMSEERYQEERQKLLQDAPVPMFWLLGKTGSGKTSVIKYLTGAEDAEVGSGFAPQTRFSRQYEFPSSENPVLRFLDTRGLGEADYDPSEDISRFSDSAHVVVITVRVMDHALDKLLVTLRTLRRARPKRPILLLLTTLHEAYPGHQHPVEDPFIDDVCPASIPQSLQRSIRRQLDRFQGLVDRVVPIDFTRPEEGFDQPQFGGERLQQALLDLLPAAYRQTFLDFEEALQPLRDHNERRAMPYIVSSSMLAASAAAVPLPWVDIPVVLAIQSHLVYRLGAIYGQPMNARVAAKTFGALGGRVLMKMAVRASLKLIPYVGMAANAALAYAYTYGLGKACCWYFGQIEEGNVPSEGEIERVWQQQMAEAARSWKRHRRAETREENREENDA